MLACFAALHAADVGPRPTFPDWHELCSLRCGRLCIVLVDIRGCPQFQRPKQRQGNPWRAKTHGLPALAEESVWHHWEPDPVAGVCRLACPCLVRAHASMQYLRQDANLASLSYGASPVGTVFWPMGMESESWGEVWAVQQRGFDLRRLDEPLGRTCLCVCVCVFFQ